MLPLYRPALKYRLAHIARWPLKIMLKIAVPLFAIKGNYPPLMLTPDDPVSPFGADEPTMVWIYKHWGRWWGDVIWLGWRNSGYGVAYYCKPYWLKDPAIRYLDLTIVDERIDKVGTIWLRNPDNSWLWETTRKKWIFYLITGYRLRPILDAQLEEKQRVKDGLEPIGRPVKKINMDGRRIFTIRTARTL